MLRLDGDDFDLSRFGALVKEAKGAVPEVSAAKLREALPLWRGPALAAFTYEPFAWAEIGRLEELRVAALEERTEAELGSATTTTSRRTRGTRCSPRSENGYAAT